MRGTVLDKILRSHSHAKTIQPDEVIPLHIDTLLIPDNAAMPIFEIMEHEYLKPQHKNIYLALTHYHYQHEPGYSQKQRRIIDLARKYQFHILDNNKGLWNTNLWEKGIIRPGSTFLARDSTVNYFAPLNNLNISSGIHDIFKTIVTQTYDFVVPEVIKVTLTGLLHPYVGGKDIALFLKRELSNLVVSRSFILEFAGPLLSQLSDQDLFDLSLHHYTMNRAAFIFPPLPQIIQDHEGVFPDDIAEYHKSYGFDLTELTSLIDVNGVIMELSEMVGKRIDRIYIGNSVGGSLDDMKFLAEVLRDKKVLVTCYITPSSNKVLQQATEQGYLSTILHSGCILLTPATGICSAINDHVPLAGDIVLATGYNDLSIQLKEVVGSFYNASISTVIASAITGVITPIEEILGC
ncbi:MAG: aconitase family protein [Candidatus Margulisiibacteriota bacterium]